MYSINPHQLMNVNDINSSFKNRNPNGKLLSDFSGSNAFWDEYKNNSSLYDKEFVRMFKKFVYYNQDYFENGVDITGDAEYSVATDFVEAVKMHLMKNDKKYSELYRIITLNDDDNSLTQNYNITETIETDTTRSRTDTYGKRNDIDKIEVTTDRTSTDTYGARNDSDTISKGERNDSVTLTKGVETNTTTEQVAPYDSESFYNSNKQSMDFSERTDKQNIVNGSQTDINERSKGEQVDSHVNSGDDNTISDRTKGEQIDTHVNSGGEKTVTNRNGNIGVKTVSQMLTEHVDFWKSWEFYNMIFQNICFDLLIIV